MCLIYSAFAVANFASSAIVRSLGAQRALFCGAACYAAYMVGQVAFFAARQHQSLSSSLASAVLLGGAVLCGVGGAVLWTAQGMVDEILETKTKTHCFLSPLISLWQLFRFILNDFAVRCLHN